MLNYDCNVTITTNSMTGEHIKNIWNIKLAMPEDGRILVPFEDYSATEKNIALSNFVKLTARTTDGVNENHFLALGFLMKGKARFFAKGSEYDQVKAQYPWTAKVMEISISGCKQLLSM